MKYVDGTTRLLFEKPEEWAKLEFKFQLCKLQRELDGGYKGSPIQLWIEKYNCEGEGPHYHLCTTCPDVHACKAIVNCSVNDKTYRCFNCRMRVFHQNALLRETTAEKKKKLKAEKRKKGEEWLKKQKEI